MKKYLALILGAVFVLGFAASAFAIHAEIPAETQAIVAKGQTQITIGGDLRVRGEFQQNTSDLSDDKADHNSYYDQRIRLSITADVTKNTQGYILIEGGGGKTSANWNWGTDSGSKGIYPFGDAKRGDLNLLEAWILHKGSGLLGIPAGIKIGHMPLALGNKLFFDHTLYGDDAIVLFADPTKELHIGLLTAKFVEGVVTKNDDSNGYVGLFAYKTKDWGISGDVTFVDHQNTFLVPPAPAGQDAHLWNFGLRGNANISGLGIMLDGEMQTGKITDTGASDKKFRGYAFVGGLNYTLSGVKLAAAYGYGSGDNDSDNKFETFVTSLSNYQTGTPDTYVYDYRVTSAAGAFKTGIANTQYIKVDASASLAKDLSGYLAYFWLRANKITTAQEALGANKSVGSEIDAKVTYKIDRNLTYFVEGGYLFAGDFYKTKTGGAEPDNAYAIRHGIQLTF
ncbi:MAG: alginate export family protein [Nitrospirae bacterium]|nr:alginate export family protein [Nitrospirota bacterium]MCL5421769.1 alginate export family protein [Nitrospirota bacterium]